MASRVVPNMAKIYNKVDVYPLVACVAVAVSFCAYKGTEHLLGNPDVSLNPERRSTMLKHTEDEGSAWKARVARHYMHKDDSLHNLSAFNAFSLAYWVRRSQVQADPLQYTREGTGKVVE